METNDGYCMWMQSEQYAAWPGLATAHSISRRLKSAACAGHTAGNVRSRINNVSQAETVHSGWVAAGIKGPCTMHNAAR